MAKKINRRQFLRSGLAGAASASILGWSFPESAQAVGTSAPILIQCELLGGCDPANFSGFREGSRYDAFFAKRGAAVCYSPAELIPIGAANSIVGLHPLLGAQMAAGYKNSTYHMGGHMNNVRVLLNQSNEPRYNNGSHEVMQKIMAMGSAPDSFARTGTLARLYESGVPLLGFESRSENFICESCSAPPMKLNTLETFTLSGNSYFNDIGGAANNELVADTVAGLLNETPEREMEPIEEKYRSSMKAMFQAFGDIGAILQYPTPLYNEYLQTSVQYDNVNTYNIYANRFRNIAEVINYRKAKNMNQPMLFSVGIGSFDTHADWKVKNEALMHRLGQILNVFFTDLKLLGVWDRVVFYTTSEFGRRLYSNGSGTDHGNGYSSFIAGGKIKPGVFGDALSATQISSLDNWPAQYDFRAVIAQFIERHLGLDPRLAYPGSLYEAIQNRTTNFDLFL